jgi:cyclophilin family peptidyl-prolyl cis-trans isomerase
LLDFGIVRVLKLETLSCTAKTKHLDGKHVVFGSVTKGCFVHVIDLGAQDVVKTIESYGSPTGATRVKSTC